MDSVIYKYHMETDAFNAPMGKVLLVAQQNGSELPTVWIEHKVDARKNGLYFIRPTGEPFNDAFQAPSNHVGSCICNQFVWHVYCADVS